MSMLDQIFHNPQPERDVNIGLYRLYIGETIADAQAQFMNGIAMDEAALAQKLRSMPDYLKFLGRLNDEIVQEIADVQDQLYGPLNGADSSKQDDCER